MNEGGSETNSHCVIEIARVDRVLLRVALEERLEVWQRTQDYWQQVERLGDYRAWVEGEIEECSSLYEADAMCTLWSDFCKGVFDQLDEG